MLVEALCVKAGRLNDGRIELAMECWRIASWPLDVSPPGRLSSVAFGVVSPELTSNLTVWGKKLCWLVHLSVIVESRDLYVQ